jgi:DnaJ-class molecular chaperone
MSEISLNDSRGVVFSLKREEERLFLASKRVCPDCFGTGNVNTGHTFATPILGEGPNCHGTGQIKEKKEENE